MKINLTEPLLNLNDQPMVDENGKTLTLAQILANLLVGNGKENVLKFYDWGITLWKVGTIDIDRSDKEILTSFIEKCDAINILIKGRLLEKFKQE